MKLISLVLVMLGIAAGCVLGSTQGPLPNAVRINNTSGWQIYPGQGYRYGPSIIVNPDNSIDMWFASSCFDGKHWDEIRYRHSNDGGHTWTQPDDVVVLTPTDDSPDRYSCCDPGVIKFDGYYYIGYTSVDNSEGQRNHVFVARAKDPRGPYEKWNGSGWGGSPQPFLRYRGPKQWGCGEPSFVLKDGKLYVFYTWNDGIGNYTDLAVCANPSADDWPAHMTLKGHVLAHDGKRAEDSIDVKYVDFLHRFIAVSTCNRIFSVNAGVSVWQSPDGVRWARATFRGARVQTGAHNVGISGNATGHIDRAKGNFISYSYGWPGKDFTGQDFGWANWATFIDPITLTTARFGLPVYAEVSSASNWDGSGPRVIDGDPKSIWRSAVHASPDAEEWVCVCLGDEHVVDGLRVTPAPGGFGFPVDFKLQCSSNGRMWTDIKSFTRQANPGSTPLNIGFEAPLTASYFRLLATKLSADNSGGYCLQFGEIAPLDSRP